MAPTVVAVVPGVLGVVGDAFKIVFRHWLLIIFSCVAVRFTYFRFFSPLAKIPGPFLAPYSRLWLMYHALISSRMHLVVMDLHKKYGPVIRLGPDAVHIADPQYYDQYFHFDRSEWWNCFNTKPGQKSLGWTLEMTEHNWRKKRIAPAFQMSAIQANEPSMDAKIKELLANLSAYAQTGERFEFARWSQFTAFDIVMEMVFSEAPGFLREARDVGGALGSLYAIQAAAQVIGIYPWMIKVLHHPLINKFGPQETDTTGPGAIIGLTAQAITRRYEGKSGNDDRKDCLKWMMEYKDQNGKPMTKDEVIGEVLSPVLAGSDTAAVSIRVALLYLSSNSNVRTKMLAELDAADAAGNLSRPVKYDEVKKLTYFDCVIKEILRIHPVLGNALWRRVPKGGVTMNEVFIPGGTEIGVNPWVSSRNKAAYGDDADVFRPERWLETDPEKNKWRVACDIYFGGGYCLCLGKNVAMLEMYKIIAEIFLNFDVMVVNPAVPWNYVNWIVFVHHNFNIQLKPRERVHGPTVPVGSSPGTMGADRVWTEKR